MASANAPYATLYNQPKYESRKQADLPPWEKEQWAWKKSKTCNSGGPNVGATPDLITPEPLPPAVPPAVSPVPCAQSAPFGTEENMANHTDKDVPQGSVFEYKFVLQCQNGWIHWQPGPNRVFSTPEKKPSLVVSQTWDFDAKGMEDGDATEAREESLSGAEEARGKSMLETEAPQETMADTEARGKSMLETEAPQETMPDTEAREEGTALASEGGDQAAISSLESRQLGEQAGSDSEQEEQEEQEQAFEACIELPDTLPNFDSAKERDVIEVQVSEVRVEPQLQPTKLTVWQRDRAWFSKVLSFVFKR